MKKELTIPRLQRWQQHAKFQLWQDAMTMNMIFGDNYVIVPAIPNGYEDYAKWWFDNELKSIR